MPILDANTLPSSGKVPDALRCDMCVIGAGPAGSTIARELSKASLRVVVLESGGLGLDQPIGGHAKHVRRGFILATRTLSVHVTTWLMRELGGECGAGFLRPP
jgi:choline dehydrogenase-like flavoprotein